MKKTLLTIALAAFSATAIPAQTTTVPAANGQGQQKGQLKKQGTKAGPQDGSGPIHTPGTGSGTGRGQRGPCR